jgi:predicted ester cyclase
VKINARGKDETMSDSDKNKQLVRRLVEEGFNKGNQSVADELVAVNYVYREPMVGEKRGPQGFKELMTMYRSAFPDARMTIKEQVGEGDAVVTRWTGTATHRGALMGVAPTGQQASVRHRSGGHP